MNGMYGEGLAAFAELEKDAIWLAVVAAVALAIAAAACITNRRAGQ